MDPGSTILTPLPKWTQKEVDFKVRFLYKRNYQVIVPSPFNNVDNPPLSCVTVYLEALKHTLRFQLPKVIMEILRTYNITITQLISNTWASILLFVGTCKLKHLECIALAFTYVHIIQSNNKNYGGKGWCRIIGYLAFPLALDKPSSNYGRQYRFVYVKMTTKYREIANINNFQTVDSTHPQSEKSIKAPTTSFPGGYYSIMTISITLTGYVRLFLVVTQSSFTLFAYIFSHLSCSLYFNIL